MLGGTGHEENRGGSQSEIRCARKLGGDISTGVMTSSGPELVCFPPKYKQLEQNIYVPFPTETCHLGRWQEAKPERQETRLLPLSQLQSNHGTSDASVRQQTLAMNHGLERSFQFSFSIV